MSRDYRPRTRPLIPAGHETWLAVSRVKSGEDGNGVDAQIEQLLRWITAPGADCSQRHDDLITLAELILKSRGEKVPFGPHAYGWSGSCDFGYGVTPIDSDTHDVDCKICGDAEVYELHGHEPDFDTHPYEFEPHCRAETGHLPGADHRWQECPTYHDEED